MQTYVEQLNYIGRFPYTINNILLDIDQWLAYKKVVGSDMYVFFYWTLLFLLVCLFNAASLMSTQFAVRNNEVAFKEP